MSRDYDILILGGGPAASAAGISLRKLAPQLRVAILEAGDYSQRRIGETLPPGSERILRQLGLREVLLQAGHLPSYGTSAAWGHAVPHHNEFIFYPAGRGWHLDRNHFDRSLAEAAAQSGVNVFTQTAFARSEQVHQGWKVETKDGQTWRASWIIDATGRKSPFTRSLGVRKLRQDNLVGIAQFYEGSQSESSTLVEAQPQGWFYSAKLPAGQWVLAFMTDSDLAKGMEVADLLKDAPYTAQRLKGLQAVSEVRTWAAASFRQEKFCGEGWCAAGDAASTFDPLSSSGMVKALRSGLLASYVAIDYLKGKGDALVKYENMLAGEFDSYLAKRKEFYAEEQRWPEQPFWQRRHQAVTQLQGI